MKLSVIIPVYRVEATLDRCLRSVLEQTISDMEVILVDDGSPDNCPQLCDEWARHDARIRVIHKPNGGLSDARNAGLDIARGDYVTFADSDDYLAHDTYGQAMSLAPAHDIVEFPISRFHGSSRQELLTFKPTVFTAMKDYWLQGYAYEHSYACNKIFRRSLFREVRFPVGRVFEDMAALPSLLQHARSVATIGAGCYCYCDNPAGITATAAGQELQMLLESHLAVLPVWCDDRYYMHVLNIQLDVSRLTGHAPLLPLRHVSPLARGLSMPQRVKATMLNLFGMKRLCRIQPTLRRFW